MGEAVTGYVYRGRQPQGLPDLEQLNAAILAARQAGAHAARTAAGIRLEPAPEGQCRKGHERTAENTRVTATGTRKCRVCRRENLARRKERAA